MHLCMRIMYACIFKYACIFCFPAIILLCALCLIFVTSKALMVLSIQFNCRNISTYGRFKRRAYKIMLKIIKDLHEIMISDHE